MDDDPIEANERNPSPHWMGYRSRLSEENSKRILYSTDEVSQAAALNLWTAQGARGAVS